MISRFRAFVLAALAVLAPAPLAARPSRPPVTVLISIDGFRADYLSRGKTPNVAALAAGGTMAVLRPSFPSVTFPNHWTLVTGMRPDHHGVVNGYVRDRTTGAVLNMKTVEGPQWWDGGQPIWITAEKAGIRTGTMFWPGSPVAFGGLRPTVWVPFSKAITSTMRADMVLDWLRRPAPGRIGLITVYFDAVDIAGHHDGPDSPEVNAALADVDAAIGRIRAGLRAMKRPANVVLVSDHGMASVDLSRVLQISDFVNRADYVPISGGPVLFLDAVPGHEAALATGIAKLPGYVHCWQKGRLPARFAFGSNPRVPDWTCLADEHAAVLIAPPAQAPSLGDHGYDNDLPSMRALFIGNGPAFPRGRRLPEFDNVDVEPLLRDLLRLPQTPGRDGDDAPFRGVLRNR
ncbi:MAG: alkaline phosphatase family protein [Sphingomonadales bacterium]|nr:alkaline phosphatase family protein [Sphingomonadales bacterium]